jgi:hypothetical protein
MRHNLTISFFEKTIPSPHQIVDPEVCPITRANLHYFIHLIDNENAWTGPIETENTEVTFSFNTNFTEDVMNAMESKQNLSDFVRLIELQELKIRFSFSDPLKEAEIFIRKWIPVFPELRIFGKGDDLMDILEKIVQNPFFTTIPDADFIPIERIFQFKELEELVEPEKRNFLKEFPNSQWRILQFLYKFPEYGKQMLENNPALVYMVIHYHLWKPDDNYWETIGKFLTMPHKEILAYLDFPNEKSFVKILSKIYTHDIDIQMFSLLKNLYQTSEIRKLLRHASVLDLNLLQLIRWQNKKLQWMVPFLEEYFYMRGFRKRYLMETVIPDIMQMLQYFPDEVTFRIGSVEYLERLHDNLSSGRYLKKIGLKESWKDIKFPSAPFEGIQSGNRWILQPIENAYELICESEEMNHCVYSYMDKIKSGEYYVFRLFSPVRATIGLVKKSENEWEVQQIFGVNNAKIPSEYEVLLYCYFSKDKWLSEKARLLFMNKTDALKSYPLPGTSFKSLNFNDEIIVHRLDNWYDLWNSFKQIECYEPFRLFHLIRKNGMIYRLTKPIQTFIFVTGDSVSIPVQNNMLQNSEENDFPGKWVIFKIIFTRLIRDNKNPAEEIIITPKHMDTFKFVDFPYPIPKIPGYLILEQIKHVRDMLDALINFHWAHRLTLDFSDEKMVIFRIKEPAEGVCVLVKSEKWKMKYFLIKSSVPTHDCNDDYLGDEKRYEMNHTESLLEKRLENDFREWINFLNGGKPTLLPLRKAVPNSILLQESMSEIERWWWKVMGDRIGK